GQKTESSAKVFKPTANPYQFKYLQTGITGPGIEQVYLPEQPPDDQVLFKKEQKWTRPQMPEYLKKATRVLYHKHNPESKDYDPTFISPYLKEIQDWIDQEWERTETGVWFWNNGVKTYITKIHYFYLTAWQTYFGYPDFRDPDREIFYLLEYCEEDPDSYGFILNTLRRFGKSAIMGAWITYRTIR